MLKSAGFSLAEIHAMSLDQIDMYLNACTRHEKRSMRSAVIAALAGARYEKDDVSKLLRSLE